MRISTDFTGHALRREGIASLFSLENRWQHWLDVEAALASAQAEIGMIPVDAAKAIADAAHVQLMGTERINARTAETSHPLMPLILELTALVGEPHGAWVHWGATTQNITQTGDALVLRAAHNELLHRTSRLLGVVADLAAQTADMPMAGRTHGQHAVPITFGFKVAGWLDELIRHAERLQRVRDDVLVAMVGGAAGTYASMGEHGPVVQQLVAKQLALKPMAVPSRNLLDGQAEYVMILGLLAAWAKRVAGEIHDLTRTEISELAEPSTPGSVGSSTMPHKQNPKISGRIKTLANRTIGLVPLAVEALDQEHEADGAATSLMEEAIFDASILIADILEYAAVLIEGMHVDAARMRENLDMTRGLIASEPVMLALARGVGRQVAHEVVMIASRAAGTVGFVEALLQDSRVRSAFTRERLEALMDPETHLGMAGAIARDTAARARRSAPSVTTEEVEVKP